jgi:hypothetical protein
MIIFPGVEGKNQRTWNTQDEREPNRDVEVSSDRVRGTATVVGRSPSTAFRIRTVPDDPDRLQRV